MLNLVLLDEVLLLEDLNRVDLLVLLVLYEEHLSIGARSNHLVHDEVIDAHERRLLDLR